MKEIKKLVSLALAVMMLNVTPIQAADLVNLDMAELNDLRKEIKTSITINNNSNKDGEIFDGIPSVKELKKRYNESVKTYKKLEKEYKKLVKKSKKEEVNEEWDDVAFYTVLYEDIERANIEKINRSKHISHDAVKGGLYGSLAGGVISVDLRLMGANRILCRYIWLFYTYLGLTLGFIISPSRAPAPIFNYSLDPKIAQNTKNEFLNDPFGNLALFGTGGANDFGSFYIMGKDFAQILYDTVDIQYYVSRNPSLENIGSIIYTRTKYWDDMNNEERIVYLHGAAEILREQASEYKMPSYNPYADLNAEQC